MQRMLTVEKSKRISIEEIMNHPWIREIQTGATRSARHPVCMSVVAFIGLPFVTTTTANTNLLNTISTTSLNYSYRTFTHY
jgi:hypothetical protein